MSNTEKIAIVTIVRNEKPFLDEWLLYHHLIMKIDHFFIYDDDPIPCLPEFLKPHSEYVTLIPWYGVHQQFHSARGDRQTKAFTHALTHFLPNYQWVAFIDVDEFIVLHKHNNIKEFLTSLGNVPAIALNWHQFGHNGHYEDFRGLVTSELTRRKLLPNQHKSITRCAAIENIQSAHQCILKHGYGHLVDANGQKANDTVYPDLTSVAHLNHYMCRSFSHWMNRSKQGYACDMPKFPENAWRDTNEGCLRKFVTEVAVDWNEYVDNYMLKYKKQLEQTIKIIRHEP